MAVMAYALPLDQIAVAAGVIFLLLFTQVNIAVINIRRVYGDKLNYGFKIPLFPVIPIVGVFLKLGLALYLTCHSAFQLGYFCPMGSSRLCTLSHVHFQKRNRALCSSCTSIGDLTRKEYRILIPYTPENPDRLINYAIRIAKENDGEVNVLRVLTVPDQTPLSAGVAFGDAARKSFEPLEKILEQENILNHHLFRISHETSEAILATIEEQKIDLVIIDFETYRNNRVLQTLATCNVLAVRTTGDDLTYESRTDLSQKERRSTAR